MEYFFYGECWVSETPAICVVIHAEILKVLCALFCSSPHTY